MLPYRLRTQLHGARSQIEQRLRRALFGSTPSWKRQANLLPWFDRPDALDTLHRMTERGKIRVQDVELLEKWVRHGYVVIDDCVDLADIDSMIETLDGLWDASEPIPNLVLLGLRAEPGGEPRNMSHEEVLQLDPAGRAQVREASDWRIHGFHYFNAAAKRIYLNPRLRNIATSIFAKASRPIAAINFMAGSQQALHQDMAVFHIYPHNYLIGAWIACEDITEESGPLVTYPGSHRMQLFPGFTDYPQTNLRTVDSETARQYQGYVNALAAQFERHEFRARKGQILLWHGRLIHGGAPITRRGSSRKSMVIHYSVRGADRAREVHGPFNW